MKLNRKTLPIIGTLILATAFMHAINETPSSSIEFDVLAEGPATATSGLAQKAPVTDTATATWRRDGRIAITTMGYQGCPVLPGSVTVVEGVASINLAVVAHDLTCGPTRESYTTVLHLEGWDEHQVLRLEIHDGAERI